MQTFEIIGRSSKTGRKQKRIVRVNSEQEARASAEAAGLAVLSVMLVPEPPATNRQIAYARDLGLQIPVGATLSEMSDLISARLDHDKAAEPRYLEFARANGIDCTPYIGKKALFDRILRVLSEPGRECDLVAWFAFRVSRELFHGRPDAPIDDPASPIVREIANELSSDQAVTKSIGRYEGRNLIWFGEYTSPNGVFCTGGSNNTIAYKKCMALLREKLGSQIA